LIQKENGFVVKLIARTPLDGLDISHGDTRLREVSVGPIWSVAPFKGADAGAALNAAHGVGFPSPGQSMTNAEVRIIWSGGGQAFLMGAVPAESVAKTAAITDQSDGWTVMEVSGAGARDVLARLVPADLRASEFGVGATMRSAVQHMAASVTRVADDTYLVLVFRSMAGTARHELEFVMKSVAARSV
jgi:heterotetrameric sarcosine oxidase gamma subunit